MTLAEIRALAEEFAKADGQTYVTGTADKTAIINEMLVWYAEQCLAFFNPRVALTTVSGTSLYDLRSASVTVRVVYPVALVMNNVVIKDFYGRSGPISTKEYLNLSDNTSVSNSATITRWVFEPPNSIRLYPAPNGAISNSYVQGFTVPAALSAESDECPLPVESEREFAMLCAARFIDPRAAGTSLEKLKRMDESVFNSIAARRAKAARLMQSVFRDDQVSA